MSKNDLSPPGFFKEETSLAAGSDILWSSGKAWAGLTLERHFFAGCRAPQISSSAAGLILQISSGNICLFANELRSCDPCAHHQQDVLILILSPEIVRRAARELRINLKTSQTERHQFRDAQVEYLGMALKTEAESGYLSGRLYGESLGTALAAHLLSKYSVAKPDAGEYKGGMSPSNLRRVIEYIDQNLTEDIALSRLAKVANLSQFRFAHNFKRATGLAPHQYIIRERMERAKKLLRETDLTVTTIAYAVGCGSPSRFTFLFRRANGVIPSVYRSSFR